MTTPTAIKLADIRTNCGTQVRVTNDEAVVTSYADAMQDAGNKFPPIVVFDDGNGYILADGFHRVLAAVRNQFIDILADVRKGTRADALAYALGANTTHGLRRTNADKRRSVQMALKEWPSKSDREIERICAVTDTFVAKVRLEVQLPTVGSSPRTGADGKTRKMPAKKPAQPSLREPSGSSPTGEPATETHDTTTTDGSTVPNTAGNRAAPANSQDAAFVEACGGANILAVFIEEMEARTTTAVEKFDFETLVKFRVALMVEMGRVNTKIESLRKAERAKKLSSAALNQGKK